MRRYSPIQPGTKELLLSSRKVHPPVGADSNLSVSRRGVTDKFRQGGGGGGGGGNFMILGESHKCMTPKFVGIQWFLITQMNITN